MTEEIPINWCQLHFHTNVRVAEFMLSLCKEHDHGMEPNWVLGIARDTHTACTFPLKKKRKEKSIEYFRSNKGKYAANPRHF